MLISFQNTLSYKIDKKLLFIETLSTKFNGGIDWCVRSRDTNYIAFLAYDVNGAGPAC